MNRTAYTPLLLGPLATEGELDLRILARAGGWQTRESKDKGAKERWLFHGDGSKAARRLVTVLGMTIDTKMLEGWWQKAVQASGPYPKSTIRKQQGGSTRGTARLKEPEQRGYATRPSCDLTWQQIQLFELSGGTKCEQVTAPEAVRLPVGPYADRPKVDSTGT